MTAALAVAAIDFYQQFLSPYKGFRCAHRVRHGRMSCSQFAKRLIQKVGLLRFVPLFRRASGEMRMAARTMKSGTPASPPRHVATARPGGPGQTLFRPGRLRPGCDRGCSRHRRMRPARRQRPRGTRRLRLRRVRPVHLTRANTLAARRRRGGPPTRRGERARSSQGGLYTGGISWSAEHAARKGVLEVGRADRCQGHPPRPAACVSSVATRRLQPPRRASRLLRNAHPPAARRALLRVPQRGAARSSRAGLRLDTREGIRKGGESGGRRRPGRRRTAAGSIEAVRGRTPSSRCRRRRS